MTGLDFKRATDLFLGKERELALALRIELEELRRVRDEPGRAKPDLIERLASVLAERGRGMQRVGEMLQEQARDLRARADGDAGD